MRRKKPAFFAFVFGVSSCPRFAVSTFHDFEISAGRDSLRRVRGTRVEMKTPVETSLGVKYVSTNRSRRNGCLTTPSRGEKRWEGPRSLVAGIVSVGSAFMGTSRRCLRRASPGREKPRPSQGFYYGPNFRVSTALLMRNLGLFLSGRRRVGVVVQLRSSLVCHPSTWRRVRRRQRCLGDSNASSNAAPTRH